MPSYPLFPPPWKEISRPQLASAFPSVGRSLWIWRYRCTYINVSEYPNLKPRFPSLPSLFLPDTRAYFSLVKEEARASLQFCKKASSKTQINPQTSLWISHPHLFPSALLGNFRLHVCSKTQLGRDVCLWGGCGGLRHGDRRG